MDGLEGSAPQWGGDSPVFEARPEVDGGVRRFVFGGQDGNDDLLTEESGRDFEW
jgi:hypothetical protein